MLALGAPFSEDIDALEVEDAAEGDGERSKVHHSTTSQCCLFVMVMGQMHDLNMMEGARVLARDPVREVAERRCSADQE